MLRHTESCEQNKRGVLDMTAGEYGVVTATLTELFGRTRSDAVLLILPRSHTSHPTHPEYTPINQCPISCREAGRLNKNWTRNATLSDAVDSRLTEGLEKSWIKSFFKSDFLKFKLDFFDFFKFVFSCQVFIKFLKLVCLLNHINNTAATILLFPVMLLLSKK